MVDFKFSVFTAVAAADAGEASLVDVLTRALPAAPGRWRVGRSGIWCSVVPEGAPRRQQGWKLHVSATPASAEEVLERASRVLLEAGSAFKFAASVDFVAALNARNTSRGHSGKFITVYPESDAEAVRLARELHEATKGLPGPRVLSDRPYAPGSLVHYRYGAFVEERRLTNDGFYTWTIIDPDGKPVEDRRAGRYTPPSWVTSPFPDNGPQSTRRTRDSGEIVLGERFAVREAIRHSNKGGVYRAVDRRTGDPVVIKEARPHVAADLEGRDTRDRLRAEARALERLGGRGLAPRLVELFPQGGHLFLAQELVQGGPLREWAAERIVEAGWGDHLGTATEMARRLVELMSDAHAAGLIVRDFNPNNIMVRPDGTPVLIDLELAVADGEDGPLRSGTPAFGAPEQLEGAPPHASADHYSLGATLCYLFTGSPPYLLDEHPPSRPPADRLDEWLTARTQGLEFPEHLRAMVLGLMADDPGRRWTTDRARDALAAPNARGARGPVDAESPWLRETVERAIEGITDELLASMDPDAANALWPVSCVHGAPDPCTLQQGAAGCLGALVRCSRLTGDPRLPEAIAVASRWIRARMADGTNRPPGLYFGSAGVAWSLLDAGLETGDERLVEDAVALAGTLPAAVASPDVTHGTAGLGLTALHLWARTGLAAFAERAEAAADALLGTVEEREGGLVWSTPADVDSKLAGRSYHGFAHGVAGVGYFLLACAEATGRDDCRAFAVRVGDALLDAAVVERGTAMWGAGAGDAPTAPYWCHGASGIGSFLVRLGAATGDARFLEAAELSARAVTGHAWRAVLGQCHGLAGNGDFLLDMAELTGDDRHRAAAWRLGRTIVAARAHRDGRLVLPDEQGEVSATWGDGMSGMLGFLLRLRYGSPRLWTVEAAAATAVGGAS